MKFVLNTSFAPHFCALFNEDQKLIAQTHWQTPKEDGARVWNFLAQHLKTETHLTFVGGVSGPGSFSSLRAGGAILNALAFRFKLDIHQARADKIIKDYLVSINQFETPFLLNSFGQRVFTTKNNELDPVELKVLSASDKTGTITAWLPEDKAIQFSQSINVDPLGPLQTILETLDKSEGLTLFIPDYEYPAVQT
jgi:hypothetical protein